ncbi:MAG: N-acetylglucosamine-6-phosphate deacetylase [Actinomycetota bacterium]|nr:N-acetylglucosamine-6-phosphate deacetylase [Actinomycetota bacterium]
MTAISSEDEGTRPRRDTNAASPPPPAPPPAIVLSGLKVVTANEVIEDGFVRLAGGRITEVGAGALPPSGSEQRHHLAGHSVLPGLIDLHVHGGGGGTYTDGDAAQVERAVTYHRRAGTTTTLASLVTAPVPQLLGALEGLAALTEHGTIAGVHLEGPFLAPSHCGAQDPHSLLEPDVAVLDELLDAGRGTVRMVTIAPELPGAIGLIEACRAAGVVAAIGHSNATYAEASAAIDAGATVATHLGNAMRTIHQRDPGIVVAALERPEVTCELIADGHHLNAAVIRLFARAAIGGVALVTDAISAAGAPDGRYRLGPLVVEVSGAHAYLEGTRTIAGSTLTTGAAVAYCVREAGLGLLEVARAAALAPAGVLGIADRVGSIAPGKQADLVVLDEALAIRAVICSGVLAVGTLG